MTDAVPLPGYIEGNRSHAEVASFLPDIGERLGQESPESFAESYLPQYRDQALDLYERYMVLAVETLGILGQPGYGWPRKPTLQDGLALVERQRQFRKDLMAMDERGLPRDPTLVIVNDPQEPNSVTDEKLGDEP